MRIDGFDCLWETCQAIYAGDQYLLHTAILQVVHDGKPEFCALVFPNVHAQNIFSAGHIDTDSNVNSSFHNTTFAAYMIMDRIHENNRIDFSASSVPSRRMDIISLIIELTSVPSLM